MNLTFDIKPTLSQLRKQGLTDEAERQVLASFGEKEPDAAPVEREATAREKITASTDPVDIYDPLLGMSADVLDDLEKTRIMNENRLRQFTRPAGQADEDGEYRGFGLDESHPDVARQAALVDGLKKLEEDAIKNLERAMKKNPLGPWVKKQTGLGFKQTARLLASLRDPFWNDLHERPRTVSELWQYAGHGSESRKKRGHQVFWNPDAKMRLWNISNSCIKTKGHYRNVYDDRRAETAEKVHTRECVRCGPSGKPAQPGTPWAKGHQHADALRIVGKEILRDMWLEAKRIHEA